jgi:hypothetical protein
LDRCISGQDNIEGARHPPAGRAGAEGKKMTHDDIHAIWDRADFAATQLRREMDDLLREMEAAPLEERGAFDARFIELQKRISDNALLIRERASAGNAAPHLKIVD